ncbi:thioredoxin family protein [Maricaulaceae bacterium MS644]
MTDASPYDEDLDVPAALDAAFARAAKQETRVLVVMGGAWCPDCRVLDAMMGADAVAPVLAERFETVKFSIGRYDRNLDSVKRLGAMPLTGAPAVLVFTAKGEAVDRADMYAWRTARTRRPSELALALDALSRAAPDPADTVPTSGAPQ